MRVLIKEKWSDIRLLLWLPAILRENQVTSFIWPRLR